MMLAPDVKWLQNYSWLIPACWGTAALFAIGAVMSSRWFRALVAKSSMANSTGVRNITRGEQSPIYNHSGPGNFYVNTSYTSAPPKPTWQTWYGILEAVCPSRLTIGETGYVTAGVSSESYPWLKEIKEFRAQLAAKGKVESKSSSIPFRKTGADMVPTPIRIEIVSVSPAIICPRTVADLDLAWKDTHRAVSFPIQAKYSGNYAVDVFLSARKKQIAQLSLSTSAKTEEWPSADYELIAEVRVYVTVGHQYKFTQAKDQGQSIRPERGNHKQGHGFSM